MRHSFITVTNPDGSKSQIPPLANSCIKPEEEYAARVAAEKAAQTSGNNAEPSLKNG